MEYFLEKNVWVLFFDKGLVRHVFFEEILHFEKQNCVLF